MSVMIRKKRVEGSRKSYKRAVNLAPSPIVEIDVCTVHVYMVYKNVIKT